MAKKLTKSKAREILHDKEVHGHPLTDKQRRFFGAIAGGAKPYKAQDGGWLDKYEQGGLVLKQKTKDNYDMKPNANESEASFPPGFVGMGNNLKGRNYSPAWGGQFQDGGFLQPPMAGADTSVPMAQLGDSVKPVPMELAMGGSLPGAVGFMYARTQSPAPSNGPYAKKTKASAQNGQEMKYYQEGLDFTPKTISQNGSRTPIYVSDPGDPRLKSYSDSLYNYNLGQKLAGVLANDKAYSRVRPGSPLDKQVQAAVAKQKGKGLIDNTANIKNKQIKALMTDYQEKANKGMQPIRYQGFVPNLDNSVLDIISGRSFLENVGIVEPRAEGSFYLPQWKKPEQQVILDPNKAPKKQTSKTTGPLPIIETPRRGKYVPIEKEEIDLGYNLPTPKPFVAPKAAEQTPTKYTFTYPTGEYNQQKTMYFPSKSALKSFTEGVRGATYQEGSDYATATGNLQDGGSLNLIPRATGDLRGPKIDPNMAANIAAAQERNRQAQVIANQEFVGPAAPRTKEREEFRKKKLAQVAATNPNFQLDDQGELVKSGYARFIDKYGRNLDKFAGGLAESANWALSTPSRVVQSTYKPGYTVSDALLGKPSGASLAEEIATDPTNLLGTGLLKGGAKALLPKLGAALKYSTALPLYKIARTAEDANPFFRNLFEQSVDRLKNLVEKPTVKQAFKDLGEQLALPRVASADPMYAQAVTDPNLPSEAIDELVKSLIAVDPAEVSLTKPQVKYVKELGNMATDLKNISVNPGNIDEMAEYISQRSANLSPRDVVPFIHSLPTSPDKKMEIINNLYQSRRGTPAENPIARYTAAQDLFSLVENFQDLPQILRQGSLDYENTYIGNQFRDALRELTRSANPIQPLVGINDPYFLSIGDVNNPDTTQDIFHSLFRNTPGGGIPTPAEREAATKNIARQVSKRTRDIFVGPSRTDFPQGSFGDYLYDSAVQKFEQGKNKVFIGSSSMSSDSYEMAQRAALMKDRLNFDIIPMYTMNQTSVRPSFANSFGGITTLGSQRGPYMRNIERSLASRMGKLSPDEMNRFASTHRSIDPTVIQNMMIESRLANTVNADINRQLGTNIPTSVVDRAGTHIQRPLLGFVPKKDGGEVVKDDMGYWNPDNWGKVVEIDSNDITMQGVDQPLIGVSDEGDVQYMEPGKDYKFKGKKVKEYPVGKKGVSVNKADENPNQKLDQLFNFTNYNKPTNGGWLDKYQ